MRPVLLCVAMLAFAGYAGWEELPPVGGNVPEEVGPGGCAARGRGYTFVAIGDGDNYIYAFKHSDETWYELEEAMPECIDNAGAMAYERNWGRLFVATDESETNLLCVYTFISGLDGFWNEDHPIELPENIGPGVALAFEPEHRPAVLLTGRLYLLVGNGTRKFYRRAFNQFPVALDGIGPGDGSEVTADNLQFDWRPHPEWTSYNLQVSASQDFTSLLIDTTLSCGEFKPGSFPSATGTYYWRVKGLRNGKSSDWSEVWSFALVNQGGSASYDLFPSEGLLMAGDEPVFDWQPASEAVSYRLQVATTDNFYEPVIDVTTDISEFISDQALETGTYYWRTCYRNSYGTWSTWSTPISFCIEYGWQQLPEIPSSSVVEEGGAMCYVEDHDDTNALYVLVGGNSRQFYRFNLTAGGVWQQRDSTKDIQTGGASITSGHPWPRSDLLRAIMGGDNTYRHYYRIGNNEWDYYNSGQLPRPCGYGSCIVEDETDYYLVLVIAGEYETTNFYKWVPDDEEGQMAQSLPSKIPPDLRLTRSGREMRLNYTLKQAGMVKINLFDAAGRRLRTLFNGLLPAGEHSLNLDLKGIGKGIYFLKVDINAKSATLKLPVW